MRAPPSRIHLWNNRNNRKITKLLGGNPVSGQTILNLKIRNVLDNEANHKLKIINETTSPFQQIAELEY